VSIRSTAALLAAGLATAATAVAATPAQAATPQGSVPGYHVVIPCPGTNPLLRIACLVKDGTNPPAGVLPGTNPVLTTAVRTR
jgi:hypothetical protein